MEEELGATINDGGQQLGSKKSDSSQMEDAEGSREREGERESEGEGDVEVAAGRLDGWHVCWDECVGVGEGEQ